MEIRTQHFLNSDDVIFDNGFERTAFRKSGSIMNGKPPIFPDLSPYTSSVIHTREGSDDLYLTIVWHFVDGDLYYDKKDVLNSFYLKRYGNSYLANLTLEYEDRGNSNERMIRTTVLNVTGFENNITAGFFTTIQYTGSKFPDYYIVYFGTVKSGNLSQQTPYLKRLMEPVFNPDNFNQPTFPVGPIP